MMRVDALIAEGYAARREGRLDEAAAKYGEAAEILRGMREPLRLAHAVRHLGDVARQQGELGRAERCLAEAVGIYRAEGDRDLLDFANALRGFALVKEAKGERADALKCWVEALELYRVVEVQAGVDEAGVRIAALAVD